MKTTEKVLSVLVIALMGTACALVALILFIPHLLGVGG